MLRNKAKQVISHACVPTGRFAGLAGMIDLQVLA